MGWRAAKAQMAAGTYDTPGDQEGAGFAEGFASTFAPALVAAAQSFSDDKREKRMLELKESLYRQRPRSSSTAAADRKAADELKEIAALADELGIPNAEAASIYYANDKNSNRASEQWRSDRQGGLIVESVTPSSPVQDEIVPEETDDLSSTEPSVNDGTVVETSEAVVAPTVETPVAETATTAEDQTQAALEETQQTPTGGAAFEPFQVASVGSIQDDLSLLTGTEEETADAPVRIAEAIDQEIEVAQATGQDVAVTYQDGLQAGATPTETRNILAAGTRIPEVYRIPEVSKITTLAEATAALDVLDARQGFIGGRDRYDINVRPMLEARVRSLTELPDLGQMLQDNQADRLREFYEFGYRQFESKVDPAQLEAHRQRAGELLNSVTSYPPIPSDLGELQALRNRVSAGEFPQAPTEWLETLNTNVRAAELQQRYGDQLTIDYLSSPDRTDTELLILQGAVNNALGEENPLAVELALVMSIRGANPVRDVPKLSEVTESNWEFKAAAAEQAGEADLAEIIRTTGRAAEAANASNDRDTAQALSELRSTVSTFQTEMTETNGEARAYLGAVESAYSMSQILENNPDILDMAGGAVPALVSRVLGEISAVRSLLSSTDATIDRAVGLRSVDSYERRIEEEFARGNLDEAARAYAIFEAQKTRMAFQIARSQQGPAGVISNQDFESAYRQISGTTNPDTWNDVVRGLIMRDAPMIEQRIKDLRNLPSVTIAREQESLLGITSISASINKSTASLEERVADAGLQDAFAWFNSGNPTVSATVTPEPEVTNPDIEAIKTMNALDISTRYTDPETGAWNFSGTSDAVRQAIRERLQAIANGGGN